MSPYLHLRRDGQSSHLHGQPRLADLDELVEAERLLEILPRSVRLPLLLGSQRRRLQHKGHKGRTELVTRASNQTKISQSVRRPLVVQVGAFSFILHKLSI